MDYVWFLKQRTWFIGMFYQEARTPFVETMRRIEAGEPPFDNPPYDESGEPPYQSEWNTAHDAERIVGEQVVSMLSASLKLFLTERLRRVIELDETDKKNAFKKGVLRGWRKILANAGRPRLERQQGSEPVG